MTPSPATASPFRFFAARVVRRRQVGISTVRVTLGGPELADFSGGGRDQSFSLFLPHPGQDAPLLPLDAGDAWFARWREADPRVRAVMRSYTVREQRPHQQEIDVDFVLHGEHGPASRWAGRARPGDRVALLGPAVADNKSVGFRPPPSADWVLLAADATALPAVAGILEWLPAGTTVRAWIEVGDPGDRQHLATDADAEIDWLVRPHAADEGTDALADAVRASLLPSGRPYAWIAGESSSVRALRRHLVGERGFPREDVTFSGYWRGGVCEEDLRAEAASATAD